jgi:hypothetical protein
MFDQAPASSPLPLATWLEAYAGAWRYGDPDAAAALFTEDASYRSHPLRPAHAGRAAIREYWRSATATQQDVELRFGTPLVSGSLAAVEWWATMLDSGLPITLPGCLVLRFAPEGLCQELREYWNLGEGHQPPPAGWGQ